MHNLSPQIWISQLGLEDLVGTRDLIVRGDAIPESPHAGAIESCFSRLDLSGVSMIGSVPTIGFVRAQYAKSFPVGAMIGYVMDGDTNSATSAILRQIRKYNRRLHCRNRDIKSDAAPVALTTMHRRGCGNIRLTHLLVPV
jgi:hypothetical protein